MPTGYEYREYKNWRGIPKPRRCPFCKQAKGEIRKIICRLVRQTPLRQHYPNVGAAWINW
jgi:hypothetical protein